MDTLARAPGGQMRGAATKAMSDIAEERQQRRYAPFAAAPLRAAARRPAGFVARSSHTAPGIARRSRLASGPGGQQQSVHIISLQTLKIRVIREIQWQVFLAFNSFPGVTHENEGFLRRPIFFPSNEASYSMCRFLAESSLPMDVDLIPIRCALLSVS